jgi:hypothetical protein
MLYTYINNVATNSADTTQNKIREYKTIPKIKTREFNPKIKTREFNPKIKTREFNPKIKTREFNSLNFNTTVIGSGCSSCFKR